MAQQHPNWMFWYPLPFWQMLLVLFAAQLVANLAFVVLRLGAGIDLPQWLAGGIGGAIGVGLIQGMARRKLAAR